MASTSDFKYFYEDMLYGMLQPIIKYGGLICKGRRFYTCGRQICTVTSWLDEAISLPSGDQAIFQITSECPLYVSNAVESVGMFGVRVAVGAIVVVAIGVDVPAVPVGDDAVEEAHPVSRRNRIQHSEWNITR